MPEFDYYLALNNGIGSGTLPEVDVKESSFRLRDQLRSSNHFDPCATRNGKIQGFVVTASDSYYKYKIEALPFDDLAVGDLIYTHEHYWIVVNVRVGSPYQKIGLMWLCNHLFRWQNGTSDIIERWGVLDSGVYSSTRDGDKTVMTADKQYKIYLPRDEDTRKLYINKRFATERFFNQQMEEILAVYEVTGFDSVSRSYGEGGHLLILNARSADYVATRDSIDEMICDYIPPKDTPGGDDSPRTIEIIGSTTLHIGGRRIYYADCEDPVWECDFQGGISAEPMDDGSFVIEADWDEDLIGLTIDVTVQTEDGFGTITVEVVE